MASLVQSLVAFYEIRQNTDADKRMNLLYFGSEPGERRDPDHSHFEASSTGQVSC